MPKSKKRFLFTIAGIAVLIVAAIFAIPRSSWHDTALIKPTFWKNTTAPARPPSNRSDAVNPAIPISNEVKEPEPPKNAEPEKSHGVFTGPSIYRNTEFGFEFSIPDGWQAKENLYGSPYSYFNLTLEPLDGKAYYPDPVGINIVEHGFVEMSYRDLKPDDKPITVAGLSGVKYSYAYEGGNNIDYIIPRPEDTFLIGYRKGNDGVFNEIISSFKFLEKIGFKYFDPVGIVRLSKSKVGDVIRGMRVASIGPGRLNSGGVPNLDDVRVVFSGEKVLTGHYSYSVNDWYPRGEVAFGVEGKEREKLPRLEDDNGGSTGFCFSNADEAIKFFGPEYGSGTATVVIDGYQIIRYPSESTCDVKFVKLISIEHDK